MIINNTGIFHEVLKIQFTEQILVLFILFTGILLCSVVTIFTETRRAFIRIRNTDCTTSRYSRETMKVSYKKIFIYAIWNPPVERLRVTMKHDTHLHKFLV